MMLFLCSEIHKKFISYKGILIDIFSQGMQEIPCKCWEIWRGKVVGKVQGQRAAMAAMALRIAASGYVKIAIEHGHL